MNNGTYPSPTPQDLLDRVLAGKPADVKARVLDLVLRLQINPNDELFLLMIGLNYLVLLVEDAPDDWQDLFINFQDELEKWTDIHLETLNSIVQKAEQEKTLAENLKRLVNTLNTSATFWNKQIERLETSAPPSTALRPMCWKRERWEVLENQIVNQQQTTAKLVQFHRTLNQKLNVRIVLPTWVVVVLVALTLSSIHTYSLLDEISQHLGM